MRASDNEQGINKLGNKEIETSRVTKEKVSVEVKQYKKNISKQKLNRNVYFIRLVLLLIKKLCYQSSVLKMSLYSQNLSNNIK